MRHAMSNSTDLTTAPTLNRGCPWLLDDYDFFSSRLVVCIDDLGEATKLISSGDGRFELTTTEGSFFITRNIERLYQAVGFVGVEALGIHGRGAYYFDLRVAAALKQYELSCNGNFGPGVSLPLASENESWETLGSLGHLECSDLTICREVTWTNKLGIPIWDSCTDAKLYDLHKMENLPSCMAVLPQRLSRLAKLDYRLRRYIMLYKPDSERLMDHALDPSSMSELCVCDDVFVRMVREAKYRQLVKLYASDPYEFMRKMNGYFLLARGAHYEQLRKHFQDCIKLFACSDIHETNIEELDPEGADIVLLAGDIQEHASCSGPKPSARRIASQIKWVNERFLPWCRKYPKTQFVVVAGDNDEFALDLANPLVHQPEASNVHYLQDSGIEIKGLKIWGAPWVKPKNHRVGGLKPFERSPADFKRAFAGMPDDIDILVTHATPEVPESHIAGRPEDHYGSEALREIIEVKRPKVCVCGHVHARDHHPAYLGRTIVMNVSRIGDTDRYHAAYRPRYFSMIKDKAGDWSCKCKDFDDLRIMEEWVS